MSIIRDKQVGFGQPILKGRRLTVFNVVSYLYYNSDLQNFLNEFKVSLNEVKEAINYCKNTNCGILTSDSDRYCEGCILSTISEGLSFDKRNYQQIVSDNPITISKDGNVIFFGTIQELEDTEFGSLGWTMAEEVEKLLPHEGREEGFNS